MPGRLTARAGRKARLPLEWGCAKRTRPGAAACGDTEAVKAFAGGLLLGAIDGLGRGQEAAVAAESAAQVLTRYGRQPLVGLVKRCHRTLMMTRGAALSLASFRQEGNASLRLAWLGVGNVEGLLVRGDPQARPAREHLPLHGGVVGYYMPVVKETVRLLQPGDTLIMSTDGVRSDFEQALDLHQPVAALAQDILEKNFRGTDDALVLVARFAEAEETPERFELAQSRAPRHATAGPQEARSQRQARLRRQQQQPEAPSDAAVGAADAVAALGFTGRKL